MGSLVMIMPAGNVTVTVTFISEWEALRRAIDRAGENAVIDVSNYDANHDGWIVCPAGENALSIMGKSVTLDLHGCVLDRHLASANESGCVIRVVSGGLQSRLTLTGSDPGNGRTVTIAGKSVEVKGGIITGGKNTYDGGVFNEGGTFTLSGSASIIGNEARYGGGVFNYYGGEFSMSDSASVTGNTASKSGGGVCNGQTGTFSMSGSASVTGNTAGERGGGVHNENTFKVSGGAKVTGNKVGTADNNVCLTRDKTITVTDELTNTDPIPVTMENPGVFTRGLSDNGTAENFVSGDSGYTVILNDGGEAELVPVTWAALQAVLGRDSNVRLVADIRADSNDTSLAVPQNVTAVLNLNGCTIDGSAVSDYSILEVSGSLTLKDSSQAGGGTVSCGGEGSAVSVTGSFTMSGGRLTGGSGSCGVYVDNGTFSLSGAPEIENGVFLRSSVITVTDELTNTDPIPVTMENPGVFTGGLSGKGSAANFVSSSANFGIRENGGEAGLYKGLK